MIAAAGGIDALGIAPGERSREVDWDEVAAARPEVVVVMPCGLYAAEAEAEALRHRRRLASLGAERHAVDAASSFSRPGPRLADGVELLGHLLHPDRVPPPAELEWRSLGL
jgi:iron complex transport system substrate-binding protein